MKNRLLNFVIAYILILLILLLYQNYVVKKRVQNVKEGNKEEIVPKKEEVEIVQNKEEGENVKEILFENEKLKVTFENINGSIKNIFIKDYNVNLSGKDIILKTSFVKGAKRIIKDIPFNYEIKGDTVRFFFKDSIEYEKMYIFNNGYSIKLIQKPELEYYYTVLRFETDEKHSDKDRFNGAVYSLARKVFTIQDRGFLKQESKAILGIVDWAGYKTKYFFFGVIPEETGEELIIEKIYDNAGITLRYKNEVTLYAGPLEYYTLRSVKIGLEDAIYFGASWLRPIAKLIFFFITFLHKYIPNYGVVIIILTIVLTIILSPINIISYKSMKTMKDIQPKIQELQRKYKDDPKTLNIEMMELYRKSGVNPFSGCFPLLLQIPIFFSLYAVLSSTIELKGAHFIFWIKDLSAKDPFYVLPILMGITMFLQQKFFTPQTGSGSQEQQKMMTYIMPVLFTFIFLNFPSGLTLYWLLYNILSMLLQYLIKKQVGG
uniref:Membrane protein insertase YidC n=1 Tax=candidate division WOR-3 bacterium TaxID=2052148 RepID=A0A7C4U6K1_UNCW3